MTDELTRIALGVVVHDGKILVIERQQREIGRSGKPIIWALPGGKIEPHETPLKAAAREVAEETGYQVTAAKLIEDRPDTEFPVYVYYVACDYSGNREDIVTPETIVTQQWVPVGSLGDLFGREILPSLQRYFDEQLSSAS